MDRTTRWETAAIREAPRRSAPPGVSQNRHAPARSIDEGADWATLQEAHAATGIPVNTLRKWARRESVPSYLESDGELTLRMVDLAAVRERAAALGRTVAPSPADPTAAIEATEPGPISAPEPTTPTAPEGTMIVPVDAWNKMLIQLGNLHEAGQQLAEARERAAKAETEAEFLRERLAEVRADRAAPPDEPVTADGLPTMQELEQPAPPPPEEQGTRFWRYVYQGWRSRRR